MRKCNICGAEFENHYVFAGHMSVHKSPEVHFQKGREPWNKGKKGIHLSPKSEFTSRRARDMARKTWKNKKIRERRIEGRIRREKIKCEHCGKEVYRTPSEINHGKHHFCSRKCFNQWRGENLEPWNKGKSVMTHPENCKCLWCQYERGERSSPYPPEFHKIKRRIRRRDNRKCQICGKDEEDLETKLHVHHIDADRENNNPDNLMSLCSPCHSKLQGGDMILK